MPRPPDILVILADDLGFSDLGCYGGELRSPQLDRLAAGGLRYTRFYNTPRCSPSRASLLTGCHPHQVGLGILAVPSFAPGDYPSTLSADHPTIPEMLAPAGYRSRISGKWHLCGDLARPDGSWPLERGFEHHYGILNSGSCFFNPAGLTRNHRCIPEEASADPGYYITDAISDDAVRCLEQHVAETPERPFFHYLAYTAPHSPLHAREEDIAACRGRFAAGWDALRKRRVERLRAAGLIDPAWGLSPRDPAIPAWASLSPEQQAWEQGRMEVYAAMVERMDHGIGRVIDTLERLGRLDNTLVLFLSDNGASAEERGPLRKPDGSPTGDHPELRPGGPDSWMHVGTAWGNVSATPFRMYKHWAHEGGISTPAIVHWPAGIDEPGAIRHQPTCLLDIAATAAELAGVDAIGEGQSLVPSFADHPLQERMLFWEHEGNAAVMDGDWKLVLNFLASPSGRITSDAMRGDWELYDLATDRCELRNLTSQQPDRVARMRAAWQAWADRVGVIPREEWLRRRAAAR